jgi:hypothetical protein
VYKVAGGWGGCSQRPSHDDDEEEWDEGELEWKEEEQAEEEDAEVGR